MNNLYENDLESVMLSNDSAKTLFELEKIIDKNIFIPESGEKISIKTRPNDERYKDTEFMIDINRTSLILTKKSYLLRTETILRRLDFHNGHQNPQEITYYPTDLDGYIYDLMQKYVGHRFKADEDHIHIYISGYAEKWAFPIDEIYSFDKTNIVATTKDFLKYCNVINHPKIGLKNIICQPEYTN